jgi:hypothetical protein
MSYLRMRQDRIAETREQLQAGNRPLQVCYARDAPKFAGIRKTIFFPVSSLQAPVPYTS